MLVETAPRRAVELDTTGVTGLRLHTRGPVTLPWIAESVVPVARTLAESNGRIVYLRRGWLHGPHVDIIARRAHGPVPAWYEIAAQLDAGVLDPTTALTEDAYLIQAEELGRLEAVPGPYTPLRPHGVVELLRADDREYASPVLNQLREVVFGIVNKPLLRTIEELADQPELATTRLAEAFIALADTHALGAAYGAFSLRSHAEAFLSWAAPSKNVRPTFANRLVKEADKLRPVVEQRLNDTPSPSAAAWRTAFAYCAGALDNAAAAGSLTSELLDSVSGEIDRSMMGPPGASQVVPEGEQPDTAFHRAVEESGVIATPSPFFSAYRLLVNLFYQQLPLLTVSPLQRYYMCYAIAETVDDVLGVSWQDRLRATQWKQSGPSTR